MQSTIKKQNEKQKHFSQLFVHKFTYIDSKTDSLIQYF